MVVFFVALFITQALLVLLVILLLLLVVVNGRTPRITPKKQEAAVADSCRGRSAIVGAAIATPARNMVKMKKAERRVVRLVPDEA